MTCQEPSICPSFFEATLTLDARDLCQDPEEIYEYLAVKLRKHVYSWIMENLYD